jgi:hypothetical protein
VAEGMDNGMEWLGHTEKYYTIPLLDILGKFHTKQDIDYLSLDVEGNSIYFIFSLVLHSLFVFVFVLSWPMCLRGAYMYGSANKQLR